MGKKIKILFLWIGDPWKRLFKAVKETKPDKIYPIIESRDPKWREFQEEGLRRIKRRLGEAYGDSFEPEIKFGRDAEEKEFLELIIAEMCRIIRSIKNSYEQTEIIWDITGAPAAAQLMVPLIGSLLSGESCDIVAQHVRRKGINDPIMHAPESSDYRKKHLQDLEGISSKTLASYREREANDEGGDIHQIRFPRFRFDLFEESEEALAAQVLFLRIPNSASLMVSTEQIGRSLTQQEKEILNAAARNRKRKAEKNNMDLERSVSIWTSTTIQRFGDMGLVECKREGLHIKAKKTYCGDLFTSAVKDLSSELLSKLHQKQS